MLCLFCIAPLTIYKTLFPYTTLFRSPRPGGTVRVRTNGSRPLSSIAGSVVTRRLLQGFADGHKGHHRHRSEEHTSELQSRFDLVCRLLLEKKNALPLGEMGDLKIPHD